MKFLALFGFVIILSFVDGCPSGQTNFGSCINDPCSAGICANGECCGFIAPEPCGSCPPGYTCFNNQCVTAVNDGCPSDLAYYNPCDVDGTCPSFAGECYNGVCCGWNGIVHCENGLCATGFTCENNECVRSDNFGCPSDQAYYGPCGPDGGCPASECHNGVCCGWDGIVRCENGICPTGFTCTNNNQCIRSDNFGCPAGQAYFGPCGNGIGCPLGSCVNDRCCF